MTCHGTFEKKSCAPLKSSMHAEDRIRLLHMVEAAQAAMRFVAGRQRSELQSDQMLLFAVLHAIEVMGEAASKVAEDVRTENENIPWKAIVGMRNRLIHAYFDVDTDMVWETLQIEIPAVLTNLKAVLDQTESSLDAAAGCLFNPDGEPLNDAQTQAAIREKLKARNAP